MATKPLKSIKFPGLPNTYTVPEAISFSGTFPASGWTGESPYTQTITMTGILESDEPIIDVDLGNAGDEITDIILAWGTIARVTTADDSITAYCYGDIPEVDIPVRLKVVR